MILFKMAKILFLIVALGTFAYVSGSYPPPHQPNSDSTGVQVPEAVTTISQWLVDTVSQKIVTLARIFHLKLRVVKFLVSLYTTENLKLLRTLIEYGIKFGNFMLRIIPMSIEDPGYWWVVTLTEFLNANVGHLGLIGLALGEPPSAPSDDIAEASSENIDVSTNPPIFFQTPGSSTDKPDSNDIDVSSDVRKSRNAVQEIHYVNENDPEVVENDGEARDEVMKMYESRIMTLDKLINARRK